MPAPVLHTARLRLRPWTLEDAEAFHGIWGDPRVIWWGHTEDLAASRALLADRLGRLDSMPDGMGWWAIEAATAPGAGSAGRIDGIVVLRSSKYDDTTELAYHLAHHAWGKGYITEAAHAVLRYGFDKLGVPLISGVVRTENAPSHRVMARLGLRPGSELQHEGAPHIRYELTADEALAQPWWPSALRTPPA